MKLPRAILFDLDDTILVAFGPAQSQWQRTIAAFADRLGPIEATVIASAIQAASSELWADPARYKYWRHRIGEARRRHCQLNFCRAKRVSKRDARSHCRDRIPPLVRRLGSENPERRARDEMALKVESVVYGGVRTAALGSGHPVPE